MYVVTRIISRFSAKSATSPLTPGKFLNPAKKKIRYGEDLKTVGGSHFERVQNLDGP